MTNICEKRAAHVRLGGKDWKPSPKMRVPSIIPDTVLESWPEAQHGELERKERNCFSCT